MPPTLKSVVAADGKTKETCIQSTSDSIYLFLEPERTVESKGFSFIIMKYIMERKNDALIFNSMEGSYL
jgi:hypothetical protein